MQYYGTRLSENISRRDSASSMVAAPHCGDGFLSLDLRTDEIFRTAGHRFFALKAFRLSNNL